MGAMPNMKDMQRYGKEVQDYIQEQRERMEKIETAQKEIVSRLDEIIGNKVKTT
jgi:maltose-binding protein MalE